MAEQHDTASALVQDRAGYSTDPVKNLRSGVVFRAEIDGSPDAISLTTELPEMNDYRNVVLLHVTSDIEAAGVNKGDQIQFTLFGRTSICRILKRRDNPANVQNDFWALQLTDKDS